MTYVDRDTRCIVEWAVMWEWERNRLQAILDRSPQATDYYPDAFSLYQSLIDYPGHHQACHDRHQTYSVEGDNAERRHYLTRLVRKSRCFSRSIEALRRAVKLFVCAWNRRQLFKRAHPQYPAHLMDFVYP